MTSTDHSFTPSHLHREANLHSILSQKLAAALQTALDFFFTAEPSGGQKQLSLPSGETLQVSNTGKVLRKAHQANATFFKHISKSRIPPRHQLEDVLCLLLGEVFKLVL